jgi:hypothetical protein
MLNHRRPGRIMMLLLTTVACMVLSGPNAVAEPECTSADTSSVSTQVGGGSVDIFAKQLSKVPTCPTDASTAGDAGSSGGAGTALTPEQLAAYLAVWLNSTYNSGMPTCQSFSIDIAGYAGRCLDGRTPVPGATASPGATPAPGPTRDQAENLVINLMARLEIPDPKIQIGPEPSLNEWNMAVVGMPYWLWTTEAATKITSVTISGYTITMTAHRESVTFDPGDGTAAITCTSMTAWTQDMLMQPSPGCGHTFTQRNEQGVNYTMRARAHWVIDWTALGYSGTLRLQTTATRSIHVGELQSVVVAVGSAATGG